jgi:hypothetical protein
MSIFKFVWAWQLGFYKRAGWRVEGGIWPRLRIVRPAKMDDYFYGSLRPSRPFGLESIIGDK